MKNIYLVCRSDFYYQNRIFDLDNPVNRDNYYYPYYLLKKKLSERGIQINTYDYMVENSDEDCALLFFDLPPDYSDIIGKHENIEKYLVLFESEPIYAVPWKKEIHTHFKKVFTWNDRLVDNKKYYKIFWHNKIPESLDVKFEEKKRFCTLIAGNKHKTHPLELYSEREKAIRWFEKNHPDQFDLYGVGWDKYLFKGYLSVLNSVTIMRSILKNHYPSYKGTIKSKNEVLRTYKFSICYENVKDIPGYITEKIFDCFFAGCVPVYLGAPNVAEQIPADTFIDKRQYNSYEDLYNYLDTMLDEKYLEYLEAIKNYVESEKIYPFSAQNFSDTLIREIIDN